MTTPHLRPLRAPRKSHAIALAACAALVSTVAPASAAASAHKGSRPQSVPRLLASAARRSTAADRQLVASAKQLKRCLVAHPRRPGRCWAARQAVQRAGRRLARAERNLARLAAGGAKANAASWTGSGGELQAPTITVSGQTLSWTRIANVNSYVFVRKVPGQTDQYSVVSGTSLTPPPVPGFTVRYSVRTAVNGSAWATEKSISYPASGETPHETPPVQVDTQAAPVLTVSGQTLKWTAVGSVTTYVLVSKPPGREAKYTEVSGTSVTPAPVPGATVRYSVRTAVNGSAWAPEVAISYPPSSPPPVTPPPTEPPPPPSEPSPGPLEMGAVVGSAHLYELPWLVELGAHTARMEFGIDSSVAELGPVVEAYAKAGIRPLLLAGFNARIPSAAEAENVANWAVAFGPGGTFWKGKSLPADTAVTDIEFGNETNNPYQFSPSLPYEWQNSPEFLARAEEYARRLQVAHEALARTGAPVGLLGIADQYSGYTTWVAAMFKAVPNLGQMVAGWTIHPYGPEWKIAMDNMISDTAAHGASSSIPIYVTEWGLSSDNGRCLENNMGWNPCMTYQEAATDLGGTVSAMRARYGGRLHAFYLFQARDQKATGTSTDREGYFGALQSNQASKGAYTTEVESLLAANP